MNDEAIKRVHWSFLASSTIALIWNLMGAINFIVQMNPALVSQYRESEQAIIEGRPLWATAAFAIGVFGGSLGCLLLLLRQSSAQYLLIASLMGVIVAVGHSLSTGIDFGPGEILGIVMMPIVVAIVLVWYARYAQSKGWLKIAG